MPFQCGTMDQGAYLNLTERNLQDAQKFILMHEVIQPISPFPYFMEDNSRFSHVVVDVVQGKEMLFHIIYLATGKCFVNSTGKSPASDIFFFGGGEVVEVFDGRDCSLTSLTLLVNLLGPSVPFLICCGIHVNGASITMVLNNPQAFWRNFTPLFLPFNVLFTKFLFSNHL